MCIMNFLIFSHQVSKVVLIQGLSSSVQLFTILPPALSIIALQRWAENISSISSHLAKNFVSHKPTMGLNWAA